MSGQVESLQRRASRRGSFGDYEMFGFQYEGESGKLGWLVTAWPTGRDPVHTYWVYDGEFLLSNVQHGYNYTDRTLIETFGPATEMEPKEKQAILQAIAEWENG